MSEYVIESDVEVVDVAPDQKEPDVSTTIFAFHNKIFHTPDCYFERHPVDDEPAFFLQYGETKLSIPVAHLTRDFGLNPDSDDGKMLSMVCQGLSFVRRIYPGDNIPNELLDGSASWKVEAHHKLLGRGRVTLAIGGFPHNPFKLEIDDLEQILEDPQTEGRVLSGLEVLAAKNGLLQNATTQLRANMEQVGREAGYIEALFDWVKRIQTLREDVEKVQSLFSRERITLESIGRILALSERPVDDINNLWATYVELISESPDRLCQIDEFGDSIRKVRDQLRFHVMRWEHICESWSNADFHDRVQTDRALRQLYHFLARHFPIVSSWNFAINAKERRRVIARAMRKAGNRSKQMVQTKDKERELSSGMARQSE